MPAPEELELLLEELELLDELELLLELELEEDDELEPLQLPAAAPGPVTTMVSIFARPAALVACRVSMLLPATKFTVAVDELVQVVQAPVPANA